MSGYHGNREPFLWVMCLPKDEKAAEAALDRLGGENKVYRADDVSEKDQKLLEKAAAAVIFYSRATVSRLEEATAAVTRLGKPLLPVFLDAVELSEGMSLLLGTTQGVQRSKYSVEDGFCEAILASPVLRELQVTPAQKKAARRSLILGIVTAAAAVLAVLLFTLKPFAAREIDGGSELAQLGLSGDPTAVTALYVYGGEVCPSWEPYGVQELEVSAEDGSVGLYLPGENTVVARGVLHRAEDFAQLTNVRELALAGNAFEDLTPLWTLGKLRRLDLSGNLAPVSLEGIGALKKLEYLNVAYCQIPGDLSALRELPALQTLVISGEYAPLVEALGDVSFEVHYPSVTAQTWEELKAAVGKEGVFRLTVVGESLEIPAGETLTVRPNTDLGVERGGALVNRGTVELYGILTGGMARKENRGRFVVCDGGSVVCGMGDFYNYGEFIVDEGALFNLTMGEQLFLEQGSFTVNGTLYVGFGGALHWSGGELVNNGLVRTDGTASQLDDKMNGRLADVRGDGILEAAPEPETPAAGTEDAVPTAVPAPEELTGISALPNDPEDLASLDEYGMTPRERAYFDSTEYYYPTWAGGFTREELTPYVDGENLLVRRPKFTEAYVARSMVIEHSPLWLDGYGELFIAPGAVVTLRGDDWHTSLGISILPGGKLIVEGEVEYEELYNAGELEVNGRLFGSDQPWGMAGNAGKITVTGEFAPKDYFRFAGAEEIGEIRAAAVYDMTDMPSPVRFAHGYRGMEIFAINYLNGHTDQMWWLENLEEDGP